MNTEGKEHWAQKGEHGVEEKSNRQRARAERKPTRGFPGWEGKTWEAQDAFVPVNRLISSPCGVS